MLEKFDAELSDEKTKEVADARHLSAEFGVQDGEAAEASVKEEEDGVEPVRPQRLEDGPALGPPNVV